MLLSLLFKKLQENLKGVENDENSRSHNINKCLRRQGIPEDPYRTKGENFDPINNEVNDLLESIGANAHVKGKKGWENFKKVEKSQERY